MQKDNTRVELYCGACGAIIGKGGRGRAEPYMGPCPPTSVAVMRNRTGCLGHRE